ncbi:unnamed protein product, partial [Darwinula stevensoni]
FFAFAVFFMSQVELITRFLSDGDVTEESSERPALEVAIGGTVFSLVTVATSSLLIHGIRKAERKLMIPWLCVSFLVLIAWALALFALFLRLFLVGFHWMLFVVPMVASLFVHPVGIHFFLVVYSHFKDRD